MKIDYYISILIPSRGYCNAAFAMALKNLELPLYTMLQSKYITGCFIDSMRNQLVEASTHDWLLFMDDDVLPPTKGLVKLIEHDKDIVTGLYFAKQPPHFPQIYKKNKEDDKLYDAIWDYGKEKLFEVDACGAGFMLVKRAVFQKIGAPYFKYVTDDDGKRVTGEDLWFCRRAREEGFRIHCDPTVLCTHVGASFIGPEFWEVSRQRLKAMEDGMSKEEWQNFLRQQRN